mmetsp:Transcript_133385/g.345258  ORF Transcript_133385/g.345258 Transcript_133385/m.345258 type:complete len:629 (+) Transcript_133385:84-1970(+)
MPLIGNLPLIRVALFAGVLANSCCLWGFGVQQVAEEDRQVKVIPLYGNPNLEGHYFVDVFIGTPPQRIAAVLDLNYSGIAFPCLPCKQCREGEDHSLHPERSSSAVWRPCGAAVAASSVASCPADKCDDKGRCTYHREGPAGHVEGHWLQDRVSLAGVFPSQGDPAIVADMRCDQRAFDPRYTWRANGVLGMGPRHNVLQELFGKEEAQNVTLFFTLCLAETGGQLTIDGYNESYHTAPIQWVPMEGTVNGYEVHPVSLHVQNQSIAWPEARVTVDPGSAWSYFPSSVYVALRQAVEGECLERGGCGGPGAMSRGACWHLPSGHEGLGGFPNITFSFSGGSGSGGANATSLTWEAGAYLKRRGLTATWCYAFDDAGPDAAGMAVLGSSWMLHKEVVFDAWQERLYVAPAECPEQTRGPGGRAGAGSQDSDDEEAPFPTNASGSRTSSASSRGGAVPAPPPAHMPAPKPPAPAAAAKERKGIRGAGQEQASESALGDEGVVGGGSGGVAGSSKEMLVQGRRVSRFAWLVSVAAAAFAAGGLCFSTRGRMLLGGDGHRRVQLRETLMDDVLGGGGGGGGGMRPQQPATPRKRVLASSHLSDAKRSRVVPHPGGAAASGTGNNIIFATLGA